MKFYVTGRSSDYPRVEKAVEEIKKRGHEISFEWTALPMTKPYAENQGRAASYAVDSIKGVVDADVYILFAHKDGNGVFAEFGAALAGNTMKASPPLYAIGDENKDAAMFHYHPAIVWRNTLEEVLDEVC